jgi:peptidoglycan hydrolase-like protein with peptidoglycan-binding domain
MRKGSRKPMTHTSGTITPKDRPEYRHTLDTEDRGTLVLWAQSRLAQHGVYEGPLDGRYRQAVALAVRQFQDSKGLKVTGVIDRRTWDSL